MVRGLAIGLSALLLAGCAAPLVGYRAIPGPYSRSELALGASDRDLRVVVRAQAIDRPLEQLAIAVAAAVPTGVGINTRFTATPGTSAHPDYALVFVINPAAGSGPLAYCDAETRAVPTTGRFEVSAAFCRFGSPLTVAVGTAERADLTDPQRLSRLVEAFAVAALPIDAPDERSDKRFLF
ncbi:MAG: hypothetical protein SF002_18420 [Alphaproteobacteria bacterium]|nr:hypothetical protein [Alphaproteobacteria bacterium]